MKKTYFKEIGKKGADVRWAGRHEVIVELTKYFAKEHQDKFLKWPTKYLVEILKWVKSSKFN